MKWLLSALLFVTMGQVVTAAEMPTDLDFYEQTANGRLAVCGTEFTFAFQDKISGRRQIVAAHGSLSYMGFPGKIVALLKFTPMDFLNGPTSPPTAFQPAQTNIKVTGGESVPFKPYQCEAGDAKYCAGLGGDDIIPLIAAAMRGGITISFNRTPNSFDYSLQLAEGTPFDPSKAEAFFEKAKGHTECMSKLAKEAFGKN